MIGKVRRIHMSLKLYVTALVACIFAFSSMALAAPDENRGGAFSAPTYRELVRTMILTGAFDIKEEAIANEYARTFHCEEYKKYFQDDFQWNDVRIRITEALEKKKTSYRSEFEVAGMIKLDRYNFDQQLFPLTADTKMSNLGSLVLLEGNEVERTCVGSGEGERVFPRTIYAKLSHPFTFEELRIPMDEAEILVDKIEAMKNKDRSLYVRFRLVFSHGADIRMSKGNVATSAVFKSSLHSVDLFYDQDLTQKFMSLPVMMQ